ncbi:MAG: hypothetical protein U9P14_09370, partial [Gemmatimonadota bacterium]|nr:hypothetical protein [Gemmatimonadota bacterium]
NPEAPADIPEGQPYQEGISELAAMLPDPKPISPPGLGQAGQQADKPGQSQEPEPVEGMAQTRQPALEELRGLEAISRLAPPQKEKPLIEPPQPQGQAGTGQGAPSAPVAPRFHNRQSQAPVGSDFRLSTYNWNWAPYLKELKKRIMSNIYPPPAFYMGIAHGRTFLRFKIMPDGTITNFELLTYTGHESLKSTSVNAIEGSIPFLPLPSDFPEDHLGITAGFFYNEFIR